MRDLVEKKFVDLRREQKPSHYIIDIEAEINA